MNLKAHLFQGFTSYLSVVLFLFNTILKLTTYVGHFTFTTICLCPFGFENRAVAATACKRRCNQLKITLQFFTCAKTQFYNINIVCTAHFDDPCDKKQLCDLHSEHVSIEFSSPNSI